MSDDESQSGFVELGAEPQPAAAEDNSALDAALICRPRTGPQILDLSMEVIMGRALACIGVCALLWFPVRVVMPWFVDMTDPTAWGGDDDGILAFVGFSAGLMLVQLLVGILSMTAVTVLVYGELVGKPVGAMDALLCTLRRSPALVGLFVVTGSLLGVGVGVITVVSFLCPLFMPLALVYYLVLTWRFSIAPSVLVLEDMGVVASIRRSWALTHKSFWRWATVSLLSTMLVFWFSGFLQVGDNLDIRSAVLSGLGIPSALFHVIFVAISALFSGVSTAVASAAMTTYYFDTRTRKEGFDLSMRLERQKALGARTAGALAQA